MNKVFYPSFKRDIVTDKYTPFRPGFFDTVLYVA